MSYPNLPESTAKSKNPLHYLAIGDLAAGYRSGKFSPVEVTKVYLQRIQELNPALGAYITVAGEFALKSARRAEHALIRGHDLGPLHGVPIGLKDLVDTEMMPTTWGTSFRRSQRAEGDAPVIRRLLRAGIVLLGKQNLLEFALGGTDDNPHYGTMRNPWHLERFAGGSSGGTAAAVAAGLCAGGIGTDTGGSIRQPSSYCGITGLKPTHGLVSLLGVFPVAPSADTMGPMTRSVEDAALLLQVMAAYEPSDSTSVRSEQVNYSIALANLSLEGVSVGVDRAWVHESADDEVISSWEQAVALLADYGAAVTNVRVPALRDLRQMYRNVVDYEALRTHQRLLKTHGHEYGHAARARLEESRMVSEEAYKEATRYRSQMTVAVGRLLSDVSVLLLPTQPTTAPRLGSQLARFRGQMIPVGPIRGRFTHLANLTGLPSLTLPCGISSEKLPIGLQIVGRAFDEATVLRVGHAYQQVTNWHMRHPPI